MIRMFAAAIGLVFTGLAGAQVIGDHVFDNGFEDLGLPPDPSMVAPDLKPGEAYNVGGATTFLYSEPNPIQTGVAPGTIDPARAGVIKGRLLSGDGSPLRGARVTVLGHPEFGQTLTRLDGGYDLAVNGGGPLTLVFEKPGWLEVQRQVDTRWLEFATVPDAIMVQLNTRADTITLNSGAGLQVARGTMIEDAAGQRQATLLFPDGVKASSVDNGEVRGLSTLSVRATEYTVGEGGQMAMPANLPVGTAYTYAVELSVDGAESISFSEPLPLYLENFLEFPVGAEVPSGFYDREAGLWRASESGQVLAIVDFGPLGANLDLDGDGSADSESALAALGITLDERAQLEGLYEKGQTLWRVPIRHFSPHDLNVPGLSPDAIPPGDDTPPRRKRDDVTIVDNDPCTRPGSRIECQNQDLEKALPLVGTPFGLKYRSDRSLGRVARRQFDITLTGSDLPEPLFGVEMEVSVAGQRFVKSYPAFPFVQDTFEWDGRDAYGRQVAGSVAATVTVKYQYILFYCTGLASPGFQGFNRPCTPAFQLIPRPDQLFSLDREYRVVLTGTANEGLGGWSFPLHHFYDPQERILYYGDGRRDVNPGKIERIIRSVAGGGTSTEEGIPATDTRFGFQNWGLAAGADGSIYVSVAGRHIVRKIDPDGIINTIAGTPGNAGFAGDGGPAAQGLLDTPEQLAVGPDGSLYILDSGNNRVRRIDPQGNLSTVAGGGTIENDFDGKQATDLSFNFGNSRDLVVGPDGTIYTVHLGPQFFDDVLSIGTDGIVQRLPLPGGLLEMGPDGRLYDGGGGCFYRVVSRTEIDEFCAVGDPDPRVNQYTILTDGSVVMADYGGACLKQVGPLDAISELDRSEEQNGIVFNTYFFDDIGDVVIGRDLVENDRCSGGTDDDSRGDGGPAANGWIGGFIPQMALLPNGDLLLQDLDGDRVRLLEKPLPGFGAGDTLIVEDGTQSVHVFDGATGRHVRTVSMLTGVTLLSFGYDADGLLVTITDAFDNTTEIEREEDGTPSAIVAPFGQRSTLTINSDGFLSAFANPAGETHRYEYTPEGLLTRATDPRGISTSYGFNAIGELTSVTAEDGYALTLQRSRIERGHEVTATTALGRESTYGVSLNEERDVVVRNTTAYGGVYELIEGQDFTITTTSPSNMVDTQTFVEDDRFGVQSPGTEIIRMDSPAGRSLTVTSSRSSVLDDPDDPLSMTSQTFRRTVNGRTSQVVFDVAALTVTTTSAEGRVRTQQLDQFGRTISLNPGSGLDEWQHSYDDRGRIKRYERGGLFVEYEYDSKSRAHIHRNAAGDQRMYTFDDADRVATLTSPEGRQYGFGYDADGNLTTVTMPNGAQHLLGRSTFGGMIGYTPPGAGTVAQSYNVDRQRVAVNLPDGRSLATSYGPGGRVQTVDYAEASVGFSYVGVDALFSELSRTPDGGSPHLISFDYDGDMLTSTSIQTDLFAYRYDDSLRLAGILLNSEPEVTYAYDDDDLPVGYGPFSITRDGPGGRPGAVSDGVLAIEYQFDGLGRLTRRSHRVNGALAYQIELIHDATRGRVAQRIETVDGTGTTFDYEYSLDGQLTEVSVDTVVAEQYDYDVNANRTSAGGESATYDQQDRLVTRGGTSYSFDENGYMSTRGADAFTYSARGELLAAQLGGGATISYGYDALGRQVSRLHDGSLMEYLYGDANNPFLVVASRTDGVLTRYYYDESDVLIGFERGGERFYVAADQVGTPRLVLDSSGAVVKQRDYNSFGVLAGDTAPEFELVIGFAGGLEDVETGLVRFGFRDYEPASGRWTARDPLLFEAGQPNLYAYVNSNPVDLRDPTGLFCVGASAYSGYGGGGKVCLDPMTGKWSACLEAGLGVGGGLDLDLLGKPAGRADADYVEASGSVGCGPFQIGASLKLDDCGDAKLCSTASMSLYGFGPSEKQCLDLQTGKKTKAMGGTAKATLLEASPLEESPLHVVLSNSVDSGPKDKEHVSGKVSCKASFSVKGGFCVSSDMF